MRRSTYLLLALLAVMMAVVYFVKRPGEVEEATYTVPDIQMSIEPSRVVKIELTHDKKFVRLERIQGHWKITDPVNSTVDADAIAQLLDGMGRFRITGLVSSNPEKQGVFLVNDRGTQMAITDEDGRKEILIIGKADRSSKGSFIRPTSSSSVYIAQGIVPDMVNRDLRDWRQRTIYKEDPSTLQSFSVARGDQKFTIRKKGERWLSEGSPLPAGVVGPVVKSCMDVRAEDFIDTALILSSPPEVHVELSAATPITFDVYPSGQSRYYLKTSANPGIFLVDKSIAQDAGKLVDYLTPPPVVDTGGPKPRPEAAQPRTFPIVKPSGPAASKEPAPIVTPVTTPKGSEKLDSEGELVVHTVKKGETLDVIAGQYGVSVDDIKKWNLLKRSSIKPGSELYIFVKKK